MKPPRTTPVFAVNPSAASFAEGLRAGIAIALPVIAGVLFGLPDYGLAALGALLTCFADPGGTLARRVPAVVAFALLAAWSMPASGCCAALASASGSRQRSPG